VPKLEGPKQEMLEPISRGFIFVDPVEYWCGSPERKWQRLKGSLKAGRSEEGTLSKYDQDQTSKEKNKQRERDPGGEKGKQAAAEGKEKTLTTPGEERKIGHSRLPAPESNKR